jgi:hypothetical protein
MNSRKKIAVLGLTVLVTFIFITTKAQPTFNWDNNVFRITTPAITVQDKANPPFTRVFLETGNGAFFTFTTNIVGGSPIYQAKKILQTWHFSPTKAVQQPVIQLNTYYDTIRIPPLTISIANFNPSRSSVNNIQTQNPLVQNEFIRITPSTSTIIPGDKMTIALTYKNSANNDDAIQYNKSILAFYYNGLENPNIFSEVPTGINAEPYQFDGVSVPAIRKHNNENLITFEQIPARIRQKLMKMNPGYNKALYLSVPYDLSLSERNIFLTLAPVTLLLNSDLGTSNYTSTQSSVKTVLIDYNCQNSNSPDCGTYFNSQELIQPFDIAFVSRDPNKIYTTPNCFNCDSSLFAASFLCSNTYTNKPIDYKITFENIGAGMAKQIVVKVTIPKGIKFPSLTEATRLFTCKIGETDIPIFREGSIFKKEPNLRYCLYRLNSDDKQIIFTIKNASLAGYVESNGDKSRSGVINFRLKTVSSVSGIPACMQSKVSIIFDRNNEIQASSVIRVNCKQACPPVYIDPTKGK